MPRPMVPTSNPYVVADTITEQSNTPCECRGGHTGHDTATKCPHPSSFLLLQLQGREVKKGDLVRGLTCCESCLDFILKPPKPGKKRKLTGLERTAK